MSYNFKFQGKDTEFNKDFLKDPNNIMNMNDEDFDSLEAMIKANYSDNPISYEKVKYYMENMIISYYTAPDKNDGKEKKYDKARKFYRKLPGIDENAEADFNNDFENFKNNVIKVSEQIKTCAQKSKEWFDKIVEDCLELSSEKNEDATIDDKTDYCDSYGRLWNYFWYKHKSYYGENPISLSFFFNKNGTIKVPIELHDTNAEGTHIKELFVGKINKTVDIVKNPEKYDISQEQKATLNNLQYIIPDEKQDKAGQYVQPKKVIEAGDDISNMNRLQFFYELVEVEGSDDTTIKTGIVKEINKILELYRLVAKCSTYERGIYKAVNARGIYQIIFNGAPGTGKTYGVKEYVNMVTNDKNRWKIIQFHPSYDYSDFVEGIRPISVKEDGKARISFVKIDGEFKSFCRSIVEDRLDACLSIIKDANKGDLNDSLKKIKIIANKSELSDDEKAKLKKELLDELFEIEKNGIFDQDDKIKDTKDKLLSTFNALDQNSSKFYYFIIDEINRADIAKVFGELMYSLEYRGLSNRIPTQYIQLEETYHKSPENNEYEKLKFDCFAEGFFIPKNLVVVGTMNDIDKSVESIDFAMRRRFQWCQVKADDELQPVLEGIFCKNYKDYVNKKTKIDILVNRIKQMNNSIVKNGKNYGLTEDYKIGPSYFKNFNINASYTNESSSVFKTAFKNEFEIAVVPTLVEYVRGRADEDQIKTFIKNCIDNSVK